MTKKLRFLIVIILLVTLCVWVEQQRPQWLPWHHSDNQNDLLLSGNIEAHESVLSYQTVQSRIVELPFDEGQWVRKGTVLAVVDATDYRQQAAIADAALAAQQRQLDIAQQNLVTSERTLTVDQTDLKQRQLDRQRAFDLRQQGFLSSAALDQSDTAVKLSASVLERDQSQRDASIRAIALSKANVHNAEESRALSHLVLGYTTLVAPFDGVITVRKAEIGEVVVPGTPVVTLADLDHIWMRAYVNETNLGRVHLNQPVSVSSDSHPGKHYAGHVSFISSEAEFTPKSVETHEERVTLVYRIKIDLDNPNHELVTGMPVDAHIDLMPKGN